MRTITAWAAGGAAALTAAFAFGASRGTHVARGSTPVSSGGRSLSTDDGVPQGAYGDSQGYGDDQGGYGFTPPAASVAPPQGMSGGS